MSNMDEEDDFIQNVSGDEIEEMEKKLEESYQNRIAQPGSRPESSNRLVSGKTRPSDLKMKGEHASLTNIAQPERIEEEKQELKLSLRRRSNSNMYNNDNNDERST